MREDLANFGAEEAPCDQGHDRAHAAETPEHGNKHHPRRHRTKQQDEEAVQIFFFLVFYF